MTRRRSTSSPHARSTPKVGAVKAIKRKPSAHMACPSPLPLVHLFNHRYHPSSNQKNYPWAWTSTGMTPMGAIHRKLSVGVMDLRSPLPHLRTSLALWTTPSTEPPRPTSRAITMRRAATGGAVGAAATGHHMTPYKGRHSTCRVRMRLSTCRVRMRSSQPLLLPLVLWHHHHHHHRYHHRHHNYHCCRRRIPNHPLM